MRFALVVLALGIGTGTAFAEPPAAPTEPPTETIPLSLGEAIALGIENNTDVQLIRYEPPIAGYDYEAAWGVYDPTLYGDYTYRSSNLPVASTFFPGEFIELNSTGEGGLRGLGPRLRGQYHIREILAVGKPVRPPACIISGGETTVRVAGSGRGGRNQEFALRAVRPLSRIESPCLVASLGTDGTDGPTDAAGAIADISSLARSMKIELDSWKNACARTTLTSSSVVWAISS